MRRALVLTGAGASLDFGAPSTAELTRNIKTRVLSDEWMKHCGGDRAYLEICETLAGYLQGGACAVNFEHVYHCAHELLFTFEPTPGAVNEFRPRADVSFQLADIKNIISFGPKPFPTNLPT